MSVREGYFSNCPVTPLGVANKDMGESALRFRWSFPECYIFGSCHANSKWPEVFSIISSSTSTATITVFFAAYGLPVQMVTDNGPQFTSDEFATFMKMNGTKHIRSAPYHPSTNGLAKRFVHAVIEAVIEAGIEDKC